MKKKLALITAFMLSFVLAFPAFAQSAHYITADSDEAELIDPAVSIDLSSELQAMENEANIKYNQILAEWAYDPQFVDDVDANFPSFYGGAYINSEKKLVIQVTSLDESIIEYFEELIDLTNVIFEEVTYSFSELKMQHAAVASEMDCASADSLMSKITGVGISIPDNAVSVYLVTDGSNSESAITFKDVRNDLSMFDNIKVIETAGYDVPTSVAVKAGSKISIDVDIGDNVVNSNRSVGFWAKDSEGNWGIVTAAHTTISAGQSIWIDGMRFGTAVQPYFSGSVDAVFVKRTNTYFTPSRTTPSGKMSLYSNGQILLAVGSTTYSEGYSSGYQVGEVIDINYRTGYGLSGCSVSTARVASGDSGGVVAGGGSSPTRFVAGLINGRQAGGNLIYVKAHDVLSKLDVTVF